MRDAQARVLDLAAAVAWRQALRDRGCLLALTNGCFDVLHAGHVVSLAQARAEADGLIVLLNSDASVRALKGPERPIYHQEHRAYMLSSLRSVDAVVLFEGRECSAEIRALCPDVYVKSDEYRDAQDAEERKALAACHTTVVWLRRLPGLSTSAVVERMGSVSDGGGPGRPPDPRGMGAPAAESAGADATATAAPVADAGTHGEGKA